MKININKIRINDRGRQDLGDLTSLEASIRRVGQLVPIGVIKRPDGDYDLIHGRRRLAVIQKMSGATIEATELRNLSDLDRLLAERDENIERKELSPSEKACFAKLIEPLEQVEAQKRKEAAGHGLKIPAEQKGRAADKVAKIVGMDRKTLAKAKTVVAAAEADPKLQPIIEEMDKTGNVHGAFNKLKQVKDENERQKKQVEHKEAVKELGLDESYAVIEGDMKVELPKVKGIKAIICDPAGKPMTSLDGREPDKTSLENFLLLAKTAADSLADDVIVVALVPEEFWKQAGNALGKHLSVATLIHYMTPGANKLIKDSGVCSNAIIAYVCTKKGKTLKECLPKGKWLDNVVTSDASDCRTDLHPQALSVSATSQLIEMLTNVGDLVCDPFTRSGTLMESAMRTGRKCVSIVVPTRAEMIRQRRTEVAEKLGLLKALQERQAA